MFDHWWPSRLLGAASGLDPHPALMLPFVLLLVCIAAMPFLQKEWWESHYAKVATVLGAVPVLFYAAALHAPGRLQQVAHEYVSFIALIGSLYVVSGSIHIRVRGEAKPWVNCGYLLAGALLAK